ncbi:MAG: kelch repeat-containing protein [Ignavibacteriaceae bacterium]
MGKHLLNIFVLFLLTSYAAFPQSIQWTQKKSLPKNYRNGAAAACNGKIYFMGGYCESTPERFEKTNYEYDTLTDTWEQKADIPSGRSNFALAAIDDKIYAIGGDPFSPQNEVYNVKTNSWKILAPMLTPRQHISCAVVNGNIYVIGGLVNVTDGSAPSNWSYENVSNINEVYLTATDSWKELAPMPAKRHGAYLAAVDDKIFVIGGMGIKEDMWAALSTVEMYDPETDKWETKASLPVPRDGFGIAVINKEIYIIGGFGPEPLNTVFVYDTESDTWKTTTDFPNMESVSPGSTVIKNRIYIAGGSDKDYNANSNFFEGIVTED